MKIQEQMVKLLTEDSWDDVVGNYPNSSSTSTLKKKIILHLKRYVDLYIHFY